MCLKLHFPKLSIHIAQHMQCTSQAPFTAIRRLDLLRPSARFLPAEKGKKSQRRPSTEAEMSTIFLVSIRKGLLAYSFFVAPLCRKPRARSNVAFMRTQVPLLQGYLLHRRL